ncbi:MAG TPA: amidase [Xanthobacteraceae bacterium]|jgi:aspartyl-tRNA(Asn)/glutamyl-tRNA(Gln) amidotransferase subunit A
MRTLHQIAARLEAAESSRALIDRCLDRIKDPTGEGPRTFLKIYGEAARAMADAYDVLRRRGATPSLFAGIPVSVKDLFDVAGDVTTSGSVALRQAPPAERDATVVARLRAAGFIPIGRTNMTEFAFSGLGVNPHYDTPRNPYDRKTGRVPGGSSSGAVVSVTDGMACVGLGSDTGGSCRIPAALCGTVGYKPTKSRIPTDGTMPLSQTLDSIGSMAPSVACCALIDAVLAGQPLAGLPDLPLDGLRLAVPQTLVLDDMDQDVSRAFGAALTALSRAGARISQIALRELNELAQVNAKGGFAAAEGYAVHRPLIKVKGSEYDPFVLTRLERGKEQDAADYIELMWAREEMIRRFDAITAPYDALIMPTVPIIAPTLREVATPEYARSANYKLLRNTGLANFFDRCSVSIPCHHAGDAPVGLMLVGPNGSDRRLLAMAAAMEKLVSPALDGLQV